MNKHIIIMLLILTVFSCKKSTQPINEQLKGEIELQQSYSPGVTDGYLKLTITEADMPADYEILRDGQTVITSSLSKTDTLLTDTTLLPNTTYTYIAQLIVDGKVIDTSHTVTLTTMDTTNHDFIWDVFEFGGEHGHGTFRDIVIVNENDIWAVGDIPLDTTYNAAHWNGQDFTDTGMGSQRRLWVPDRRLLTA